MHITHLAIWVTELEVMKDFYERYFDAQANNRYHNPAKGFSSYFLSFASGGRLELMHSSDISSKGDGPEREYLGLAHFAMSVGSKAAVDELTERLRADGYAIVAEPRTTGDGYYESVILDPEGNRVEVTV